MRRSPLAVVVAPMILLAAACGAESDPAATDGGSTGSAPEPTAEAVSSAAAGVRLVSAEEGAAILADAPDDLVVLDVRTAEEFAEGHLAGATMIDFYAADFADRIAALDPDVPYLLYCRSGNRSGQTRALMDQLGFEDVADIDGGILAWDDAGLAIDS